MRRAVADLRGATAGIPLTTYASRDEQPACLPDVEPEHVAGELVNRYRAATRAQPL